MLLTFGRSFIKIQYSSFLLFSMAYPFRIATQLQYYVKHEKCKLNDVIFPSTCDSFSLPRLTACASRENRYFTCHTSVRSKNIFTDISRYPNGKHEIICFLYHFQFISSSGQRPKSWCCVHHSSMCASVNFFFKKTSPQKLLAGFLPNFTRMFLR